LSDARHGIGDVVLLVFLVIAVMILSLYIWEWSSKPPSENIGVKHIPSEVEILAALQEVARGSAFLRFLISAFTFLIFLGVAIDIRFLWRLSLHRETWDGAVGAVDWGLLDVVRVSLIFLLALFCLQALYPVLKLLPGSASDVSLSVAFQFVAELVALLFLLRLIPAHWGRALRWLGLSTEHFWRGVSTGVKSYIGFLPVLLLLNWLTELIASLAGVELEPQEQLGLFFRDISASTLVFLVCFMVFIGPVFEEIFFRGFAYQAFRRYGGRWMCILVTAILFSALHASVSVFLPIMGLGILLAYVFEKSGSLIPSITIHICQNSLGVAGVLLIRSLS
jgi:membrane protease YdiL (CAAX protease family)